MLGNDASGNLSLATTRVCDPVPLPVEPPADGNAIFVDAMPTIAAAIRGICQRNRLGACEQEEFRSLAMLKLVENDYEVLRRFRGSSSLRTYLGVVLQRVLLDQRVHTWGKWRASVAARRFGDTGVTLDRLLNRDGFTLHEVIELLKTSRTVEASEATIVAMASALPARPPIRMNSIDVLVDVSDDAPLPDERVARAERRLRARQIRRQLHRIISTLTVSDRLILKLRFVDALPIVDIAKTLRIEAKPLYRRVTRILQELRQAFHHAGITIDYARDTFQPTE